MNGHRILAIWSRRVCRLSLSWLLAAGMLPAPGGLSAQAGADPADQLRASLAAADRAAGESAQQGGLMVALEAVASEHLVLVYPGAPVVAGRDAVRAFLLAQPGLANLVVGWTPLHVEASSDGTFGVSYGVTGIMERGATGTPLRFGKYMSAWRRTGAVWRLVAHAQLHLTEPQEASLPPGFAPPPPLDRSDRSFAFALADSAFAALAGREGAERAFAAYAAEDAVTFPAGGVLTRGPEAIGRGVRDAAGPTHWRWWPVAAGGDPAGELGFTVGEAEIRSADRASYSKYLTLWRREAGGAVRFLADGGNARPAPPGR